jgi:RNA polymerase sigma-70 factor, ECF subfamily
MSSVSSPQSSSGTRVAPDPILMARIRTGDERALATLYDRYSQVVYSVALRVLGDTTQAEDILQEIFMQIWRNPQTFDSSRGSLAAWLSVIARHRAIDYLRRRRPETDIEEVIISADTNLDQIADKNLTLNRVRSAVETLPPEQRKPLEMAFFEGLTHAEIAAKTGEPLGTIKTRIRSALITLRKAFAA